MENAVVQQIRKRITCSKFGEIFFVSSFPQYDVEYVTKLLAIFEKPDTAKLVREVAVTLMGGRHVNLPCAGGGSVSSETGWDGRKKDEENEDFRLRCWLHAAKTIKASQYVPTKRKGYGR